MDESQDSWQKVEPTAVEIFQIWMNGGDLEWAREAWDYLHKAGLVGVKSPLGKTASSLHILTMGIVYHEFCRITWDVEPDQTLDHMIEQLDLDPLALGVFAGSPNDDIFEFVEDEDELLEAAVENATHIIRKELHQCLVSAYGGDSELHARLLATCDDANRDDDDCQPEFESIGAESLQFVKRVFTPG